MREYETVYVLKADLPAEQLSSLKEKLATILGRSQGHVLHHIDWGKRRTAYDIEKARYAHYFYLQYLTAGEGVSELERTLKYDDNVLKFLTVKLADEVDVEQRKAAPGSAPLAPDVVLPYREGPGFRRGAEGRGGDRRRSDRRGDMGDEFFGDGDDDYYASGVSDVSEEPELSSSDE